MIELKHTKVYVDGIEQNTKVYVSVNKPLEKQTNFDKAPIKPICANCWRVNCKCNNSDIRERKTIDKSIIVRTVTVSEQIRTAKRSMLTAQKRIELLEKKAKDLANMILLLSSE